MQGLEKQLKEAMDQIVELLNLKPSFEKEEWTFDKMLERIKKMKEFSNSYFPESIS